MIEEYSDSHREGVRQLDRTLFPDYAQEDEPWTPGRQLDDPVSRVMALVSVSEGGVQGYVSARCSGEVNYRLNLMVDPAWQRKGLGRSLLADAESTLAGLGGG